MGGSCARIPRGIQTSGKLRQAQHAIGGCGPLRRGRGEARVACGHHQRRGGHATGITITSQRHLKAAHVPGDACEHLLRMEHQPRVLGQGLRCIARERHPTHAVPQVQQLLHRSAPLARCAQHRHVP